MAADFLILHGLENHRAPQHWQFLLAAHLVEQGHNVRYPALPMPDTPELTAWLTTLDRERYELTSSRLTVVCHSLSCLLWFHAASRGGALVDRVLLVSPPASDAVPDSGATFRLTAFDPAPVSASAREIHIAASDADPYNPAGAQSLYGVPLGVTATIVPGGGHLTPDTGYGPWPWALQWCLAGTRQ